MGQEKFTIIKGASHESHWPSGIATLDSRTQKRDQIMLYHVNIVATLGEKSVIEINPANNKHMPVEMISDRSFYFVIGNSGIGNPGAGDETVTTNAEELLEDIFPQVSIDDPGQILSNYKFQESEIKDIKNQVGEEGFDYINANCREASFPKSINTLTGRLESRDEIKKFSSDHDKLIAIFNNLKKDKKTIKKFCRICRSSNEPNERKSNTQKQKTYNNIRSAF